MTRISSLIFSLSIAALFSLASCDKDEAQIPSYLNIESIDLETTANQGTDDHKISVVWITVGGDLIGPFELPCTIPILKEGEHEIVLKAGVRINGIAATRMIYPPFDEGSSGIEVLNSDNETISTITLIKDSVVSVHGIARYHDDVKFLEMENFEGAGLALDTIQLKDTSLTSPVYTANLTVTNEPSEVFEGQKAGYAHLTEDLNEVIIRTVSKFPIPESTGRTFVELNYKNTDYISVGYALTGNFGTIVRNKLFLKPTEEWNKVYVSISPLEDALSNNIDAENFYVFIRGALSDGETEADIYIDNLKVISE
jgi:hypothetical protein